MLVLLLVIVMICLRIRLLDPPDRRRLLVPLGLLVSFQVIVLYLFQYELRASGFLGGIGLFGSDSLYYYNSVLRLLDHDFFSMNWREVLDMHAGGYILIGWLTLKTVPEIWVGPTVLKIVNVAVGTLLLVDIAVIALPHTMVSRRQRQLTIWLLVILSPAVTFTAIRVLRDLWIYLAVTETIIITRSYLNNHRNLLLLISWLVKMAALSWAVVTLRTMGLVYVLLATAVEFVAWDYGSVRWAKNLVLLSGAVIGIYGVFSAGLRQSELYEVFSADAFARVGTFAQSIWIRTLLGAIIFLAFPVPWVDFFKALDNGITTAHYVSWGTAYYYGTVGFVLGQAAAFLWWLFLPSVVGGVLREIKRAKQLWSFTAFVAFHAVTVGAAYLGVTDLRMKVPLHILGALYGGLYLGSHVKALSRLAWVTGGAGLLFALGLGWAAIR